MRLLAKGIHGKRIWLLAPVAAYTAATWWANSQRPAERITSHEEIEDPVVAAAYGRIATWPQMRLLRKIVIGRTLSMTQKGDAADIGCGPGHLVIELARRAPGLRITGLDLADEMLEKAISNARQARLTERVDFRKGDAGRLPLEDESLDLVLSTLSLHHWSQPVVVLDEIARVLRPGGAFLIFDLRRDIPAPAYTLLWFATRAVVPQALRRVAEPLSSCHAAYSLPEAAELARQSSLTNWRIVSGPLWMFIEGRLPAG
jgi:ubiquinone/menaquinone biosynthesis C-methylase UbiE